MFLRPHRDSVQRLLLLRPQLLPHRRIGPRSRLVQRVRVAHLVDGRRLLRTFPSIRRSTFFKLVFLEENWNPVSTKDSGTDWGPLHLVHVAQVFVGNHLHRRRRGFRHFLDHRHCRWSTTINVGLWNRHFGKKPNSLLVSSNKRQNCNNI